MPPDIAALPQPRVAVLLGGPNGDFRYTPAALGRLAAALQSLGRAGRRADDHAVAAHAGRRSPTSCARRPRARRASSGTARATTPIRTFLAHADAFIAPADSVNMTGEPCATGKPVYVFEPEGGSAKFTRFHEALRRHGATRPLPERFERLETWSYTPLNSSETIAAEIARRWAKRRQMLGTPAAARAREA